MKPFLPVEVGEVFGSGGDEGAVDVELLAALGAAVNVSGVVPSAVGVGFAGGADGFVAPCAGADVACGEVDMAVVAAVAEFAVADGEEA